MWNACRSAIEHYADFEGRSNRPELWWFYLAYIIVSITLLMLGEFHWVFQIAWWVFVVSLFLPSLAVSIRRLHDSGKSGWWFLILFIPFFGWIVFLVFMLLPSDDEADRYGRLSTGQIGSGEKEVDKRDRVRVARFHEQNSHQEPSWTNCHECMEYIEELNSLRAIAQRAGEEAVDDVMTEFHEQNSHRGRSWTDCRQCMEYMEQLVRERRLRER